MGGAAACDLNPGPGACRLESRRRAGDRRGDDAQFLRPDPGHHSVGGMGFIFAPRKKAEAQQFLQETMSATKRELQHALPFAMEPVVYDFAINPHGTTADLLKGDKGLLPAGYYAFM